MEQFQNNDMEQVDDDNYDMIDMEDLSDDFESFNWDIEEGFESLHLDTKEDFDMYEKYQFKTGAHQSEVGSDFKYPAHIKRNEDMGIEDIIKDSALPFLPAKSLVRFKTVCKDWGEWINGPLLAHRQSYSFRSISGLFCQPNDEDPSFISLNPKAYGIPSPSLKFLPEPVDIISSCNGLLCCRGCNGENVYYICNPVNKEWKMLPKSSLYHGCEPAAVLAFEPSQLKFGADYDLICAVTLLDHPVTRFEIYSSTKGTWRVSEEICCNENASILKSSGFYMKGIAYWELWSGKAMAFDLKEEQCGIQPLPSCNGQRGVLTEMRGELCYVLAYEQDYACTIDIYGDIDMKLKHRIALNPSVVGDIYVECRALPCIDNELLIILVGRKIYSYHVRAEKLELLCAVHNDCMRYLPYLNSLVSLPSH